MWYVCGICVVCMWCVWYVCVCVCVVCVVCVCVCVCVVCVCVCGMCVCVCAIIGHNLVRRATRERCHFKEVGLLVSHILKSQYGVVTLGNQKYVTKSIVSNADPSSSPSLPGLRIRAYLASQEQQVCVRVVERHQSGGRDVGSNHRQRLFQVSHVIHTECAQAVPVSWANKGNG